MNRAHKFADLLNLKPEERVLTPVNDMTNIALDWAMAVITHELWAPVAFIDRSAGHAVELDPNTLTFTWTRNGQPWTFAGCLKTFIIIDGITVGPWNGDFVAFYGSPLRGRKKEELCIAETRDAAVAKAVIRNRMGAMVDVPRIFLK